MSMNTRNGSDMVTKPQSKHSRMTYNLVHYGSLQNETNMLATTNMLNDIYHLLVRCCAFKNGSDMFTESARDVDHSKSWCLAWSCKTSMQLNGMLSHLLYSSLCLRLGYKVIYFFQKYVQHFCFFFTNVCYIFISIVGILSHMQLNQ